MEGSIFLVAPVPGEAKICNISNMSSLVHELRCSATHELRCGMVPRAVSVDSGCSLIREAIPNHRVYPTSWIQIALDGVSTSKSRFIEGLSRYRPAKAKALEHTEAASRTPKLEEDIRLLMAVVTRNLRMRHLRTADTNSTYHKEGTRGKNI